MSTLIVMDDTGDSRHTFNAADAAEVKAAEERFKELTGLGYTAAARVEGGKSRHIREFDPTVEDTLFFPRLKGG